jgi:hypothetical protein
MGQSFLTGQVWQKYMEKSIAPWSPRRSSVNLCYSIMALHVKICYCSVDTRWRGLLCCTFFFFLGFLYLPSNWPVIYFVSVNGVLVSLMS